MELLQKHFDTALESPDGIKKLRELILTLAMQGKLVKQDPKDQPASELLKEIQAEKERLIKEGKIKKQKELPPIKLEEVPYAVPKGWAWTRLGTLAEFINGDRGKNYPNKEEYVCSGIPWINTGHIKPNGTLTTEQMYFITQDKYNSLNSGKIEEDDLVYCLRGATFGKTAFVTPYKNGAIASSLMIIRLFKPCRHQFMFRYLTCPLGRSEIFKYDNGSAQPNLSANSVQLFLFPLPPLAEQKRIVAKIDELMALCDKLEDQRNARNDKRLAVHTAAINRLLTAADTNGFDSAWQFITRHFNPLYSVKENVAELKKAILTLAMQGKLVKQDPKDKPASELIKEIQAEKERLIKEGKIKKQKELPPIKPEEVPYEVPKRWEWVRFGEIAQHNSGKTLDSGRNRGVPRDYITTSNLYWGRFILDNVRQMLIQDEELEKCTAKHGDLLICEGGEAGRAAVWMLDYDVCFQNHVHRARFFMDIEPFFSYRFFEKINATGEINQHRKGVGISNMSSKALSNILFPLPPLAEQKRIVAKIDELMALCDNLEKQIDQATAKQTALFDAVLAKV